MKLSVVISAFNEEEKIKDCLESVKDLADEIVFVNNSSTDNTSTIAGKYTRNIITQKNDPTKIDLQKNIGFENAKNEWILSLDADEEVTPELAEEIKNTLNSPKFAAYYIPRKNIIFAKWIKHTGWYPDYQLRLFQKGKGRFASEHVHEILQISGEKGYLREHILHHNYETVSQFLQKMMRYAPNEAEEKIKKDYVFSMMDAIRFPKQEFLSRFFAREGYKDGMHGLILSLLMAFYHFVIFCYIWEKEKFSEDDSRNTFINVKHEVEKSYKESKYWFVNAQIKETKNPLKKSFYKLSRKLIR